MSRLPVSRLRLFGPPRPDARDRAVHAGLAVNPALWLVAAILMLEALVWLPPFAAWLRAALVDGFGLIPDLTLPEAAMTACCTARAPWRAGLPTGEIWRMVTYQIVHTDILHAAMNAGAILLFAPPVLIRMGTPRFLLFFVASGVAGALAVLGAAMLSGGGTGRVYEASVPVVGASGAIFGLWLAGLRAEWDRLRMLPPSLRTETPRRVLALALFCGLGLNLIVMAFPVAISGEAHIGGALFGFLAAPLFYQPAFHAARRRALEDDRSPGGEG